jgi:hypothetical protein
MVGVKTMVDLVLAQRLFLVGQKLLKQRASEWPLDSVNRLWRAFIAG